MKNKSKIKYVKYNIELPFSIKLSSIFLTALHLAFTALFFEQLWRAC